MTAVTTRRVALLVVTAALAATTGGCTSYSGETWIGDRHRPGVGRARAAGPRGLAGSGREPVSSVPVHGGAARGDRAILGLASRTPRGWTERMLADLDEVLLDHVHCEKKAASTAVNLIFRYAQHPSLMAPLSALAREELAHFEQMLGVLASRDVPFRRLHPSPYATRLVAACRDTEPGRLLDTLLVCGLIEARSCERMQLLAEGLEGCGEGELAALYRGLLVAEARHHGEYVRMARGVGLFDEAELRERAAALAAHEAAVLADLPPQPRLHA